jgi:hypothetical protein
MLPAGVIAVDAAAANNAGLGTDWSTALRDLDAALQMAAATSSGGGPITEIWVKKGRYIPTGIQPPALVSDTHRSRTFLMVGAVGVYGGFDGTETLRANRAGLFGSTVLSGDLLNDSIPGKDLGRGDDSYAVVRCRDGFGGWTLDGFTIEFGNANGGTLQSVTLPIDTSTARGAGICFDAPSTGQPTGNDSAQIRNVTIRECRALESGGGAYVYAHGAAPSTRSAAFVNCVFQSNTVYGMGTPPGASVEQGFGGGLYVEQSGPDAWWYNCVFDGNSAAYGGAVAVGPLNNPIDFVNCLVVDNQAQAGGGFFFPQATNFGLTRIQSCTIALNDATASDSSARIGGGGIWVEATGGNNLALLENSIVYGNTARQVGNAATLEANVGGPGAPVTGPPPYSITARWSCVGLDDATIPPAPQLPRPWFDPNPASLMITGDPLFTSPSSGILSLKINSPCVNAANDTLLPSEVVDINLDLILSMFIPIDLTGGAREQNTIVGGPGTDGGLVTGAISDMGCFETLMDGN